MNTLNTSFSPCAVYRKFELWFGTGFRTVDRDCMKRFQADLFNKETKYTNYLFIIRKYSVYNEINGIKKIPVPVYA